MTGRPPHLTQERADRFKDQAVVDAYPLRWPYPPETFKVLADLMASRPGIVLDAGTGTGDIARPLASRVGRVDAVDVSAAMLARARMMPGGNHPALSWIESRLEDYDTTSQYALVTAGESLHWMDWDVVLPRFRKMLVPGGMLAIVQRSEHPAPWRKGLTELIATYSTVQDYEPFDLVEELERRSLLSVQGKRRTAPVRFWQTVPEYVESFHSRSSLSRSAMSRDAARAFDELLRRLVEPWTRNGSIELQTMGDIVWGHPLAG